MPSIRWAASADYNEILGIEEDQFPDPWTKRDFKLALNDRSTVLKVYEEEGRVLGYVLYKIAKRRMDVLNLAVAYEHMRRGIGREMIKKLISDLSRDGRKQLTARVRERNLAGQLFFRAMGFRWVRTARGVYQDSLNEDAYDMIFELEQEAPEKAATECSTTS